MVTGQGGSLVTPLPLELLNEGVMVQLKKLLCRPMALRGASDENPSIKLPEGSPSTSESLQDGDCRRTVSQEVEQGAAGAVSGSARNSRDSQTSRRSTFKAALQNVLVQGAAQLSRKSGLKNTASKQISGNVCKVSQPLDSDLLQEWIDEAKNDKLEMKERTTAVARLYALFEEIEKIDKNSSVSEQQSYFNIALERVAPPLLDDLVKAAILGKLQGRLAQIGLAKMRTLGSLDLVDSICGWNDATEVAEWLTRAIGFDMSNSELSEFPPVKHMPCTVNLSDCPKLLSLGSSLQFVDGSLDLSDNTGLQDLGNLEKVGGDLELYNCISLESLSGNLIVSRDLMLEGCERLQSVGPQISCDGYFNVLECSQLESVHLQNIGKWMSKTPSVITNLRIYITIKTLLDENCTGADLSNAFSELNIGHESLRTALEDLAETQIGSALLDTSRCDEFLDCLTTEVDVTESLRAAMQKVYATVKRVLDQNTLNTNSTLDPTCGFKSLTHLVLESCSDLLISKMEVLQELKVLCVSGVLQIVECPELRSATIIAAPAPPEIVEPLSSDENKVDASLDLRELVSLEKVDISGTWMNAEIRKCSVLTKLESDIVLRGNLGLSYCPKLTSLNGLEIRGNLSMSFLESLTKCNVKGKLSEVSLTNCLNLVHCDVEECKNFSAWGCSALSKFSDSMYVEEKLTMIQSGAVHLMLPQAEAIEINDSSIVSIECPMVKKLVVTFCPGLKSACLSNNVKPRLKSQNEEEEEDIDEMPHMEKLKFENCYELTHISFVGAETTTVDDLELSENDRLEEIELVDTNLVVGKLSLSSVANLTQLSEMRVEDLRIVRCPGIETLASLEQVDILYLEDCSQLVELCSFSGTCEIINCPALKSLPSNCHADELTICQCRLLSELPSDLSVDIDLSISSCDELLSIPENVRPQGKLEIVRCSSLQSLPRSISATQVHLRMCSSINDVSALVGAELQVLSINGCHALTSLPDGIHTSTSFRITSCNAVERLPNGLHSGQVEISKCPLLAGIGSPGQGQISTMIIEECNRLENIPMEYSEHVTKLVIRKCENFHQLPSGFIANHIVIDHCGSFEELSPLGKNPACLEITSCLNFLTLPQSLHVNGPLLLHDCVRLETLPEDLYATVLDLSRCTNVQHLPDCVLHWSENLEESRNPVRVLARRVSRLSQRMSLTRRSDLVTPSPGEPYSVIVGESGIQENDDELSRISEYATPLFRIDLRASNISASERRFSLANATSSTMELFLFGPTRRSTLDSEDDDEYQEDFQEIDMPRDLEGAITYWKSRILEEVPDAGQFIVADVVKAVPETYTFGVIEFLSVIHLAKELKNETLRPGLLTRLAEVLELLATTEESDVREAICIRMSDSSDACGDKPIWALNQMYQHVLIVQARGDRGKLFALGKRLMRLDVVHHYIRKFIEEELPDGDEVSIYLRFEIALRDTLDLPVSAKSMLFPDIVVIPDDNIREAEDAALAITETEYEHWLESWEEWQRQIRSEQAATLDLKSLSRNSLKRVSLSWQTLIGTQIEDPVRLLPSRDIVSLQELLRHWVETGNDYFSIPRTFEYLENNLTRCI